MVPFGLAEDPAHFQQLINDILKGVFTFGYLDYILIFSKSIKKYFKHLRTAFDRLGMANLNVRKKKCDFFKYKLHYLGHVISRKVIYLLS